MIRGWLSGAAAVLVSGPLLFLIALAGLLMLAGFVYGLGRRHGRREQARWHVLQGVRWALRRQVVEMLPRQRRGEP